MKNPIILAIDTSCDETSAAVSHGRKILSNIISSQINIHKKWGGVVPHLAKRAHQDKIDFVIQKAIITPGCNLIAPRGDLVELNVTEPNIAEPISAINAIAVTIGPGLAPALEVGIKIAKQLAQI